MAIARMSVKAGGIGKAQPHAAYIAREGRYANRRERGEVLEATGHGNMPAWAAHDSLQLGYCAHSSADIRLANLTVSRKP